MSLRNINNDASSWLQDIYAAAGRGTGAKSDMVCPYCERLFENVSKLPKHYVVWSDDSKSLCKGSGEIPA